MGKKLPPSQKYGAPLYAAAWPSANLVFVAGGGGKKSSGMKNRCNCRTLFNQRQTFGTQSK